MAGPSYTHAELEQLWIAAGGNPSEADIAAAIAQAESGGCQYAKAGLTDDRPVNACTYRQTTTENSYGLWQINRDAHPQFTASSLYTAGGNAAAAVEVAQAGLDFTPWTTYTNGSYFQYLANPSTTGPTQPIGPLSGTSTHPNLPVNGLTRSWAQLMRTLAIEGPRTLREAKKARVRMRRAVR